MKEDTPEEFMHYIKCRLELFTEFIINKEKDPVNIYNRMLFKEEFTYENWLKGKIGRRLYKTGFETISSNEVSILGYKFKELDVSPSVTEGFEYSIYRFKKYNFKRIILYFK